MARMNMKELVHRLKIVANLETFGNGDCISGLTMTQQKIPHQRGDQYVRNATSLYRRELLAPLLEELEFRVVGQAAARTARRNSKKKEANVG